MFRRWQNKIQLYLRQCRESKDYEITWEEANLNIMKNNGILVDVRSPQEYEEGHVDGAICLPHYEIYKTAEKKLQNKQQIIVLYCKSSTRSNKAYKILKKMGYLNVYQIKDGLNRSLKERKIVISIDNKLTF